MALAVDHVLLAVDDLAAAHALFARHGLTSYTGGAHREWGTANVIAPLGSAYLEAIGVVDRDAAAASVFGRWVASTLARGRRFMGWCVRTDDLDGVAARLGLTAAAGARARPDGHELRWRTAGSERALHDPSLPFFIQWDVDGALLPGAGADATLDRLEVRGDERRLGEWLGAELPGVVVRRGEPAVRSVVVAGRTIADA
jgi:Glyoxalase-like domain